MGNNPLECINADGCNLNPPSPLTDESRAKWTKRRETSGQIADLSAYAISGDATVGVIQHTRLVHD